MATIEIDEQVAREWLKAYDYDLSIKSEDFGGDPRTRLPLAHAIREALPRVLEVGWHAVTAGSRRQTVLWWNGNAWAIHDHGVADYPRDRYRSVKYLGQ